MEKKRKSKYKKLCDLYNITWENKNHVIDYIVNHTKYKFSNLKDTEYDLIEYILQSIQETNTNRVSGNDPS